MPQCVVGGKYPDLSSVWLLICGVLVFFMQVGFLLLEVGLVRVKAHHSILLKNSLDAAICGVIWWSVGYSLAFGQGNEFYGRSNFFGSNYPTTYYFLSDWFFQYAFSATASTILSGAVAERCQVRAYIVYTVIFTAVVYPVAAHWVWSDSGWLSPCRIEDTFFDNSNGLLDFAGSGVVHMLGGAGAFVGAYILGPRIGRFTKYAHQTYLEGYSIALATLGAFILWMSWFALNAGSIMNVDFLDVAGRICVNSTLSISSSCLCASFLSYAFQKELNINTIISSVLAGGVAISGPCAYVQPYGAFVIGVVSGFVTKGSSALLIRLKIDDPVQAIPVHFFNGVWGVISPGLFATKENIQLLSASQTVKDWGVFYGGSGRQLGVQLLGIGVIIVWTLIFSVPLFLILKSVGWLRIPVEEEVFNLSVSMQAAQERSMGMFSHQREQGPITYDMANVQIRNEFNQFNQIQQLQQRQNAQYMQQIASNSTNR